MQASVKGPLNGLVVVDFTTLAPGPLASLMLANAGAEVIKVEKPGIGDEMRIYKDAFGDNGVTFALLNAGKKSVTADLKDPKSVDNIKRLIGNSDIVLEQFRPGVMDRLGLGYDDLKFDHPGLIYCSITGFGQRGPKAGVAAHDLNYVADSGMLALGDSSSGKPAIPQLLAADLAAGSYPAVMNILLALQERNKTGKGRHIDVSMTDCLFPLMFWCLGLGWGAGTWPEGGRQLLTGGSARYQVYVTSDKRFLAVAALEDRFWNEFCEIIGFEIGSIDEETQSDLLKSTIQGIIQEKSSSHWRSVFQDRDVCAVVANTLEEAVQDDHYNERLVFNRKIRAESGDLVNALPMPLIPGMMVESRFEQTVPRLGEHNLEYGMK